MRVPRACSRVCRSKARASHRIPALILLGGIEAVERAIMRAEVRDIDDLAAEFPTIPDAVFDAMRYRAKQFTAQALNFDGASSGSLVLAGIAAAVSYWLLDKTLSETVKQAWEESDLHVRIKQFLLRRLPAKVEAIAKDIRPSRWPQARERLVVETHVTREVFLIVVTIPVPTDLAPIPTAREMDVARNRQDSYLAR